jgi:hypothetical protein
MGTKELELKDQIVQEWRDLLEVHVRESGCDKLARSLSPSLGQSSLFALGGRVGVKGSARERKVEEYSRKAPSIQWAKVRFSFKMFFGVIVLIRIESHRDRHHST